jgi:chaperonin GroEL (HSP60 family)
LTERVTSKNIEHIRGRDAWRANLRLASLVSDKVSSTFGPEGAYKIVAYNRGPEKVVKITKDPEDIVEELGTQYPAIRIFSEAVKVHRSEVGDGATEFVIILSELLKEADGLRSKGIHPITIVGGYNRAAKEALRIIDHAAAGGEGAPLDDLLKIVDCGRDHLTEDLRRMIIEAGDRAARNGEIDKKRIRILRKQGADTSESKLISGVVLKKEKAHPSMPDDVEKPRITLMSGKIGIKPLEIKKKGEGRFPVRLDIQDPAKISEFKDAERQLKEELVDRIRSSGANVIVTSQPIDDEIKGDLARKGLFAVESVDQEDLDALREATGAEIVGDILNVSEHDLGSAVRLETGKIGSDRVVTVSGCDGTTLLLRGNTPQSLDELERTVKNSISVLKLTREDGRTVLGGGAIEMQIAEELKQFAVTFKGREQLAVQAFAKAVEEVPRRLAANSGLNPLDAIIELTRAHSGGLHTFGVSREGCADMGSLGIRELARVKASVVRRACDVAALMLRIDELMIMKGIPVVHKS